MRLAILLPALASAISSCAQNEDPLGSAAPSSQPTTVAFYDVGARPRAIAVADFNGDANPDVVVANSGDGTVSILLGNGSGQLNGTASFAAGREPADVDAMDMDRDGDVDLVIANHETSSFSVLLNDGRGRFTPASGSPFDTGARPHVHGLATGDFDGDGWMDVAVESADSREIRVLRGGEGGLSSPISIPVGTMPYSRLGVGALTSNGAPHVLVPGHTDNTVRAIGNDGGVLRLAAITIQLTAQPWMVVAGDANGDGRHDIVVVESNGLSIWLAGDAGFVHAPGSPLSILGATEAAIGNLDGDAMADVVVGPWDGHEVTVIMGGSSSTRRVRMCERPVGLAIGDLNGDGRGELLATCTMTNKLALTTIVPR
jgi:hypothetical protein